MRKSIFVKVLSASLLAGLFIGTPSTNADSLRVPKTSFPACAQVNGVYCVESVIVTTGQGMKIPLMWVPSGNAVPAAAAATTSTDYAPVAELNSKGVVTNNSMWANQDQRAALTSGTAVFMDVSALIGSATFPAIGAIYDSTAKTFDTTRDPATFATQVTCWDPVAKVNTAKAWSSCYQGAVVMLLNGKVLMELDSNTAAQAAANLKIYQASSFVDLKSFANNQQMPAIGAQYTKATNTFDNMTSLIIPISITNNAVANGWVVAGMTSASPSPSASASSAAPTPTTSPVASPSASTVAATPAASSSAVASSTPSATTTVVDTSTVVAALSEAGRALSGRWTAPNWSGLQLDALGYDGLFVDAKAANEFSNNLFVDVLPTLTDGTSNKTSLASQVGSHGYAVNLDPNLVIKVTVRTGTMKTGVTVSVGVDTTISTNNTPDYSQLTLEGSAVTVPLANNAADCSGETGVAKANVRQFQTLIIPQNDQSGFGIDGISGNMYVGTNGVCSLSTPTWDQSSKTFSWDASAPHFAPDGTTINQGFYKAIIPFADAALLWGLTNPADAATALKVSVTTQAGGSAAAINVVSAKAGNIIIDVSGFTYSKPKLTIALKKGYKASKAKVAKMATPQRTLICGAGAVTKKVSGASPACPKGFKQIGHK
jgi:hypothetical protein